MGLILDKLLPGKGERDTYFNMTEIYDTESARCPDPEENLKKDLERILEQIYWRGYKDGDEHIENVSFKEGAWDTAINQILALFKPITAEELANLLEEYSTSKEPPFGINEEVLDLVTKAINKKFGVDNEEEN